MAQTGLSSSSAINSLLSTYQWGTSNGKSISLTYSFPDTGSTWKTAYGDSEPFSPNSFASLNLTQRQNFRDALAVWSDVANINLTETLDTSQQGDIRAAFTTLISGSTAAYAYLPYSTSTAEAGDVWLNTGISDYSMGSQGFATLVHELGHAFGFKHPFTAEPENSVVLGSDDSTQYTVMSYTDYQGAGYTQDGNNNAYYVTGPSTPMLYDIAAIQFLYGANTATRSGDDTYTFSNTQSELKTIWDGGGTDTFDLSNQTLDMKIDLNAGQFSSIGVVKHKLAGNFIQATNEAAVDNIAIAYNVAIENAIGGDGNDSLTGNQLDNQLSGGKGNDIIDGNAGDDTVIYTGKQSDYTISQSSSGLTISSSNEGTDTLRDIEFIKFTDITLDALTLQPTNGNTDVTNIPATPADVITRPTEGDSNHTNYFLLQIASALTTDAQVSYTTRDGSAIAGQDYLSSSGTATIKAGETSTVIAVTLIGDTTPESDETFELVLSNPSGARFPDGVTEITATRTIIDDDSNAGADLLSSPLILVGSAQSDSFSPVFEYGG